MERIVRPQEVIYSENFFLLELFCLNTFSGDKEKVREIAGHIATGTSV